MSSARFVRPRLPRRRLHRCLRPAASLGASAAALKHFKDWAEGQVEACKKFQTALNGHNIFAVQAVGTLCEGSGRPDLLALLEVKGLAAMLVALPTNYTYIQISQVLGGSASGSGTAIAALSR